MAEDSEIGASVDADPTFEVDSAAVALALDGARYDPALRGDVAGFLQDQRALIADQRHHLHEQFRHLSLKYFSERLKVALQVFVSVGATAVALFIAGLVWQAATDKGLVIEAFSVPPDLAAKGITGQVLASQLEDKLDALQAATDSGRAATTYSNDWGHDIKVEIPETGVSISELQRYLREWLGHETRIEGEVFHTAEGLKLTVRTGGEAGDSVSGGEADLDHLLQVGAEALYARTQPYRYAVYLHENGRPAEARAAYQKLESEGAVSERAWAFVGEAAMGPAVRRSLALVRQALALDSDLALAWRNVGSGDDALGYAEDSLQAARKALALLGRPDHGGFSDRTAAVTSRNAQADVAEALGDFGEAVRAFDAVRLLPSYYGSREVAGVQRAQDLALGHDIEAAQAALPPGASDVDLSRTLAKWGAASVARLEIAMTVEDWPGALEQIDGLDQLFIAKGGDVAEIAKSQLNPFKAVALAQLGRHAEAQAAILRTPTDCYPCILARGQVAALAGQPREADRWFAEAVRQGPSLPKARLAWARAKLARGDRTGALALLKAARTVAPRDAEALELMGEAQLLNGDLPGAAGEFSQANALAPHWGRLHLKWAQALARQGKAEAAGAQLAIARSHALTPAEHSELAGLKI